MNSIIPASVAPFPTPAKTAISGAATLTTPFPADTQATQSTALSASGTPSADTDTTSLGSTTDSQREASIRQAADSFKNFYALGDKEFSLFKDASGKYITRYVSLRDGSVTYLPEPTLVRQLQAATGSTNTPVQVAIHA